MLSKANIEEQKEYLKKLQDSIESIQDGFEDIRRDPMNFNNLFEIVSMFARTVDTLVESHSKLVNGMVEYSNKINDDGK